MASAVGQNSSTFTALPHTVINLTFITLMNPLMMPSHTMKSVLLLHGLHMHGWAMKPFGRLLQQHGFTVRTFDYYSVLQTLPQHSAALYRTVSQWQQDTGSGVHLVGHSLGGLVLRHFAASHDNIIAGARMVTLGTPHRGSSAAQQIHRWGWASPLLGGAYRQALDGDAPKLPEGIELGSLAGNRPHGMGLVLGLRGENDGTVLVEETQCTGMRDHIILPVSHTGMLLNKTVVRQTAHFLQHGQFAHHESQAT